MATDSKAPSLAGLHAVLSVRKSSAFVGSHTARKDAFLAETVFHTALTLERRRAERSRKRFILMLLDAQHPENGSGMRLLQTTRGVLEAATRETDLLGWYKKDSILGVIFTEIGSTADPAIAEVVRNKVQAALEQALGRDAALRFAISLHMFPEAEGRDENRSGFTADTKLYRDLQQQRGYKALFGIKRFMDIAGSGALLLLLFPVLAIIALIIKLTSEGPVLFEQERLGQFGARFKCLKFRTMHVNVDSQIHRDYVQQFINGGGENDETETTVYKITKDPRVTAIGRFLRKYSLDELPQFWNVLRGEMSLVGPRPPVPYEFEIYDIWHRRRVLEVKPGVTGLWQVSGRSRSRFDDMVRLDVRYCQCWSLWLDIKILLATPWAVLSGDGAY